MFGLQTLRVVSSLAAVDPPDLLAWVRLPVHLRQEQVLVVAGSQLMRGR